MDRLGKRATLPSYFLIVQRLVHLGSRAKVLGAYTIPECLVPVRCPIDDRSDFVR